MDLLMGPTFTIDVPSSPPPPPYDADRPSADAVDRPLPSYGFFSAESSESSSSIGTPDDSDDENDAVSSKINQNDEHEEEEEEVHSKLKSLTSLDSLEDSLPIKRGLSNHFIGKSKSFSDLSQVNTVKELQKQENPFNKRRRVLMASKLSRKSSFYAWSNPKSMPLLPVHEDEDDYEEENPEEVFPSSSSENKPLQVPQSYASHMRLRLRSFKCRSVSDLKEHDEEEEEQHDE